MGYAQKIYNEPDNDIMQSRPVQFRRSIRSRITSHESKFGIGKVECDVFVMMTVYMPQWTSRLVNI